MKDKSGYTQEIVWTKEWIVPDDRYAITIDGCVERVLSVNIDRSARVHSLWVLGKSGHGDVYIPDDEIELYLIGEPIEWDFTEAMGTILGKECYNDWIEHREQGNPADTVGF
jgi:hypothetical protein